MAMQPIQIRLSPKMMRTIQKLSAKLGLDRTNVIRLALAQLAEREGISDSPPQP
jgi:antitoxin component of RelBE/YafQ-DinJ toxin-antitoxin module